MPKPKTYDAIVLGLGGMGSAALYHLAKRGLKVAGVEQHHVAHDRGSSHGNLRMIRKAYHEHPDYVPLLHRAYDLWDELQDTSQKSLFEKTGLLLSGRPESETMQGLLASCEQHNLPHEKIDAKGLAERFPQFNVPEDYIACHDPLGGFLQVERCVETHIELAEQCGADVHLHQPAIYWRADNDQVTVTTDKHTLQANALVLAIGPWAAAALTEIGVHLHITRKVQLWYGAPDLENYTTPAFSPFFFDHDYGQFYGFPSVDYAGLKVAEHTGGEPLEDPSDPNPSLKPEDEAPVLRFLADTLPGFKPELRRHSVCMYTNTPDKHFIIDRHPNHDNVVLAAGFSGHGFKFASVVGEILADLATKGASDLPADFLRLERFKAAPKT